MSSNVGLTTPRGSGTSGYVQRNSAHLKPRDNAAPYPRAVEDLKHRQRQPDQGIIEHERKREIEVKVFELRDKLEEDGIDEDAIDDQCAALRKKLEVEQSRNGSSNSARGLKSHQVHELAQAKIQESEKLRRALGISKDYEEGSHWRRQEERAAEREKVVKEMERTTQRERSVGRSRSRSRSVSRSKGSGSELGRSFYCLLRLWVLSIFSTTTYDYSQLRQITNPHRHQSTHLPT
ncbi:hypothetical protein Q7P35_001379 [Cladosporium inversicolor]